MEQNDSQTWSQILMQSSIHVRSACDIMSYIYTSWQARLALSLSNKESDDSVYRRNSKKTYQVKKLKALSGLSIIATSNYFWDISENGVRYE